MRILTVILTFLITSSLFAQTEIRSQIHDIDMGEKNESPLIFLTSGHVVSMPDGKKIDLDLLRNGLRQKKWFLFTIDEDREIISFKEIPSPITRNTFSEKFLMQSMPFEPSILKDMNEARKYFYEARTDAKKESQCFNRAHVWSYEWRIKNNLYSSKAWLFFTRKYIRKYKYEWWFHVAPMVHVVHDGKVRERVMDIKYSRGPAKLKQWTDIFMRDGSHCPVVEKYTDHADYPESGTCFVMKSSMYYYQPVDLEMLEQTGTERFRWLEPEVRHAYLEAFDVTL